MDAKPISSRPAGSGKGLATRGVARDARTGRFLPAGSGAGEVAAVRNAERYDPEFVEVLDALDRAPPVYTAGSAAELMAWLRRRK